MRMPELILIGSLLGSNAEKGGNRRKYNFPSPIYTDRKRRKRGIQEMNEQKRMKILDKVEELTLRVGALAAAAKLIENELVQLQAVYYQQTQEGRSYE